jgi:hypothetical protein
MTRASATEDVIDKTPRHAAPLQTSPPKPLRNNRHY